MLAVPVLVVLAVVAHLALDERLARAAADAGLSRSQVLQWVTELGEGVWWLAGGGVAFAVFAALRRHNAARWAFALVVSGAASALRLTGAELFGDTATMAPTPEPAPLPTASGPTAAPTMPEPDRTPWGDVDVVFGDDYEPCPPDEPECLNQEQP